MKTIAFTLASGSLALAAFALTLGCDANHVLGTSPTGGAAGSGTEPSSNGVAGASGVAGTTGSGTAGSPGTAGAGAAGAGLPSTGAAGATGGASGAGGAKVMAGPLGPAQSWTGYIENYMFASGSDALKLTFATDANGVAKGTIVFGMGTPPAAAADPKVGYPPALAATLTTAGPGVALAAVKYVAEGFSYAFDGGSLEAQRLRFSVDMSQLWAGWCALQTPPPDGSSGCLPTWSFTELNNDPTMCAQIDPSDANHPAPVDCAKANICVLGGRSPCVCTSAGCGTNDQFSVATFDVFVTGDSASGSAQAQFLQMNNVHFLKD